MVERDPPQAEEVQIVSHRQTDNPGYPGISTRLKLYQGERYLLAASSAESPLRARLSVPTGDSPVEVMFEDRRMPAQSGGWEDDFAPHAVQVYRC